MNVYAWCIHGPWFFVIKYGLRAIKGYCNFILLSIELHEDCVIQDEAHRRWRPNSKTIYNSIDFLVVGSLGPCLSRFKFMHFIIACMDECQSVSHVSRSKRIPCNSKSKCCLPYSNHVKYIERWQRTLGVLGMPFFLCEA